MFIQLTENQSIIDSDVEGVYLLLDIVGDYCEAYNIANAEVLYGYCALYGISSSRTMELLELLFY